MEPFLSGLHSFSGAILIFIAFLFILGRRNDTVAFALRGTQDLRRQNGEIAAFVLLAVGLDQFIVPFGLSSSSHYSAIIFSCLAAFTMLTIYLRRIWFLIKEDPPWKR